MNYNVYISLLRNGLSGCALTKRERVAAERENEGGSVDGRVVCDALRIARDYALQW